MNLDKKIIGLDFLRFSMAILMVIFHTQSFIDNNILNYLAFNGFYATSIFFLLSGFILTHVYQNKIKSNLFSQRTFLIRRFSALYPIHIFTMAIALSTLIGLLFLKIQMAPLEINNQTLPRHSSKEIFFFGISDIFQYMVQSLFLLHAWDYRLTLLNGASWSVSALLFFYIFFGYFAKLILKTDKIFLWLMITWLLYLLPPLYFTVTQNFSNEALGLLHRNPLFRLPEFVIGIIFYKIVTSHPLFFYKYKVPFLLIGFFGFIFVGYLVKSYPEIWFYMTHNGLFIPTQLAFISGFLFLKINSEYLIKIIKRLGKASLTLYMLHLPLLAIMTLIYKFIYGILNSTSLSEAITLGKNLEYLGLDFLMIFLIVLIPSSLFLQEKIFTPLQARISESIIQFKESRRSNKTRL